MLRVIPLDLREANDLIEKYHRHHKPVVGHRFSLGVVDGDVLHGAIVVGRPVARMCDSKKTVEVTRLVTDGMPNACSILYARAARIAQLMGYQKIQTYILEGESGVSLTAAGWSCEDERVGGRQWKHTDGKPRREDQPTCFKQRWSRVF